MCTVMPEAQLQLVLQTWLSQGKELHMLPSHEPALEAAHGVRIERCKDIMRESLVNNQTMSWAKANSYVNDMWSTFATARTRLYTKKRVAKHFSTRGSQDDSQEIEPKLLANEVDVLTPAKEGKTEPELVTPEKVPPTEEKVTPEKHAQPPRSTCTSDGTTVLTTKDMAIYIYGTKEAELGVAGKIEKTNKLFPLQKDKGAKSAVGAEFPNGVIAKVTGIWWGVICSPSDAPASSAPALTRTLKVRWIPTKKPTEKEKKKSKEKEPNPSKRCETKSERQKTSECEKLKVEKQESQTSDREMLNAVKAEKHERHDFNEDVQVKKEICCEETKHGFNQLNEVSADVYAALTTSTDMDKMELEARLKRKAERAAVREARQICCEETKHGFNPLIEVSTDVCAALTTSTDVDKMELEARLKRKAERAAVREARKRQRELADHQAEYDEEMVQGELVEQGECRENVHEAAEFMVDEVPETRDAAAGRAEGAGVVVAAVLAGGQVHPAPGKPTPPATVPATDPYLHDSELDSEEPVTEEEPDLGVLFLDTLSGLNGQAFQDLFGAANTNQTSTIAFDTNSNAALEAPCTPIRRAPSPLTPTAPHPTAPHPAAEDESEGEQGAAGSPRAAEVQAEGRQGSGADGEKPEERPEKSRGGKRAAPKPKAGTEKSKGGSNISGSNNSEGRQGSGADCEKPEERHKKSRGGKRAAPKPKAGTETVPIKHEAEQVQGEFVEQNEGGEEIPELTKQEKKEKLHEAEVENHEPELKAEVTPHGEPAEPQPPLAADDDADNDDDRNRRRNENRKLLATDGKKTTRTYCLKYEPRKRGKTWRDPVHQVVARIRNTEKNQKLAQKTIAACFRFYVEDNDDDDVFRRELGIAFTRAEQWALAEIAAM